MDIFSPADILIPKASYRENFAVVACDQYTSQPDYWRDVENIVKDSPSALHMIIPEIYLEQPGLEKKIRQINQAMETYLSHDLFNIIKNQFIYMERLLRNGKKRRGLIGKIDLAAYDYTVGALSPVRATEATVLERIPPRIAIRQDACLESPHILLLIDDPEDSIIGGVQMEKEHFSQLYQFPLMMDSGSLQGWQVNEACQQSVLRKLELLLQPDVFFKKYGIDRPPLVYAVGDGNHSLATAKACYDNICKKIGEKEAANHPARYALVELENLHDPSIEFEPVHRTVFDIDRKSFIEEMNLFLQTDSQSTQQFVLAIDGNKKTVHIGKPTSNMAVGSIQCFIDKWISEKGGRCDYIHGDDVAIKLSYQPNTLSILLPSIEKSDLFKTVILDGALTRKTFSMGSAYDKRFYFECRKIK